MVCSKGGKGTKAVTLEGCGDIRAHVLLRGAWLPQQFTPQFQGAPGMEKQGQAEYQSVPGGHWEASVLLHGQAVLSLCGRDHPVLKGGRVSDPHAQLAGSSPGQAAESKGKGWLI